MVRVEDKFAFELLARLVVLLRLPVQVAEAEVHVGLGGRDLRGGLELGDGFGGLARAIQGFAEQDMGSG